MQRLILGIAIAAPAATVSYTLQRLVDAAGEPASTVLLQTHIPYFWRAAMAGLHGLTAGLLVALLVAAPDAWLARLPGPILLSVLLSAAAMCVVP